MALRLRRPGPYQVQAAIAALHAQAPSGPETDWEQIADLYDALARMEPSPVVALNRAVAVAFARGPAAGLDLLEPLLGDPALARYAPLHAAHAELLKQSGDAAAAATSYTLAIQLSENEVEREELERRRAAADEEAANSVGPGGESAAERTS